MAKQSDTLSADGTITLNINDGNRYLYKVTGDFGSGTISVQDSDSDEIASHTTAGGNEFAATGNQVKFVLTGSTSPDLTISVLDVES